MHISGRCWLGGSTAEKGGWKSGLMRTFLSNLHFTLRFVSFLHTHYPITALWGKDWYRICFTDEKTDDHESKGLFPEPQSWLRWYSGLLVTSLLQGFCLALKHRQEKKTHTKNCSLKITWAALSFLGDLRLCNKWIYTFLFSARKLIFFIFPRTQI